MDSDIAINCYVTGGKRCLHYYYLGYTLLVLLIIVNVPRDGKK